MDNLFLYISSFITLSGFILYFVLILLSKKEISKVSGLDVICEMLNDFTGINVLLNKGKFTYYDIKRKVVKLNSNCYYGKNLDSIAVGLIETGMLINDKRGNKIIDICRNVLPTLKILYVLPIIAIIINHMTYNVADSVLSLFVLLVFAVVCYIMIDFKTWLLNYYLKKSFINREIINFIRYVLYCDWLFLIGEVMMIFRFIFILFNISI